MSRAGLISGGNDAETVILGTVQCIAIQRYAAPHYECLTSPNYYHLNKESTSSSSSSSKPEVIFAAG